MIFQIAKKAGQVEKTIQKEKAKKSKKENGIKVISNEDLSADNSTGISIMDLILNMYKFSPDGYSSLRFNLITFNKRNLV